MEKDSSKNLPKVFVPTQTQLDYLDELHANDHAKLDHMRETIAKAVCMMAAMSSAVDGDIAEEATYIIRSLGNIHFELKKLESWE